MSTGRAAGACKKDCQKLILQASNIQLSSKTSPCCVSQVFFHPAKGGPGFELLRRGGRQSEEEVEKGDFCDTWNILTKYINLLIFAGEKQYEASECVPSSESSISRGFGHCRRRGERKEGNLFSNHGNIKFCQNFGLFKRKAEVHFL